MNTAQTLRRPPLFVPGTARIHLPFQGRRKTIFLLTLFMGSALAMVLTHAPSLTYSASPSYSQQNVQMLSSTQSFAGSQPTVSATTPAQVSSTTPVATSTTKISARLVRVSQLDVKQYASQAEYNEYAYSACSTASMLEVINAYWGYARYRITDVLAQEEAANAISASQGLLDNDGISRTMRRFGFDVSTPTLSLDQLISIANQGKPVIVGWPPSKYEGGHLVVVIGGDKNNVRLADSSLYNRTSISSTQFLSWWGGFAAIATPDKYSVLAINGPTITASFINQVFQAYGSPVAGQGQQIYDILNANHIDPAIALAFFLHESRMGTQGEARKTKAWGNTRCVSPELEDACVDQDRGGYALVDTWIKGLKEWCWQILNGLYVGAGKVIVDDIIPRYAPYQDNNDEKAYIQALKTSADTWRSGKLVVA